jgi:hypothetical protein
MSAQVNPTAFLPFAATVATFVGFVLTRWAYVVRWRELSLAQVIKLVQAAIVRRVRASRYVTAFQATRSAMTTSFEANFDGSVTNITSATADARRVFENTVGAAAATTMTADAKLLFRQMHLEPQLLHRLAHGGDEHDRIVASKKIGTSPEIVSLVAAHASGDVATLSHAVGAILKTVVSTAGTGAGTSAADLALNCDLANALIALGMTHKQSQLVSLLHSFVRVSAGALGVPGLNVAMVDACTLALTVQSGSTIVAMAQAAVPLVDKTSRQFVKAIIQLTQLLADAVHLQTEHLLTSRRLHSALFDVTSVMPEVPEGTSTLIRGLASVVCGDDASACKLLLSLGGVPRLARAEPLVKALVALGGRRSNPHGMRCAIHDLAGRGALRSASGGGSAVSGDGDGAAKRAGSGGTSGGGGGGGSEKPTPPQVLSSFLAELCLPLHSDLRNLALPAQTDVGPNPMSDMFEVLSLLQRAEIALLTQGFRTDLALHKIDVVNNVLRLLRYPDEERASVVQFLKAGAGDKDATESLFSQLYDIPKPIHTFGGEKFNARICEIFGSALASFCESFH